MAASWSLGWFQSGLPLTSRGGMDLAFLRPLSRGVGSLSALSLVLFGRFAGFHCCSWSWPMSSWCSDGSRRTWFEPDSRIRGQLIQASAAQVAHWFGTTLQSFVCATGGRYFSRDARPDSVALQIEMRVAAVPFCSTLAAKVEEFLSSAIPGGVCGRRSRSWTRLRFYLTGAPDSFRLEPYEPADWKVESRIGSSRNRTSVTADCNRN